LLEKENLAQAEMIKDLTAENNNFSKANHNLQDRVNKETQKSN